MTASQFGEILRYYRSVNVIDLTGITFFASAGAHELEAWVGQFDPHPRLILSRPIQRLLEIVALDELADS